MDISIIDIDACTVRDTNASRYGLFILHELDTRTWSVFRGNHESSELIVSFLDV